MNEYEPQKIEKKWQKRWKESELYKTEKNSRKKKYYCLVEFPYPSGEGLHVGHIRSYTAMDIIARKRRAEGYNVLYPIGWDAFGLPTENYALKTGIHPKEATKRNTDTFRQQLQSLGFSFDWEREINTTDPEYYKWTQWIFLQFFKRGLAYKGKMPINWCLSCKIGLANEEIIEGKCERCGGGTEKRDKEQWMLAITKYADRLDRDLDTVDYLEKIKIQQRNWIGRSEGALLKFQITNSKSQTNSNTEIEVFTTRPDTLFGATYLVLAPENPHVEKWKLEIENWDEVREYVDEAKKKKDIERTAHQREKTGMELKGIKAVNPANKEEISIWVADYILSGHGTGAIMAVPAHDERDFEFAKKFKLPIVQVVDGGSTPSEVYVGDGTMINSAQFNGVKNGDAKMAITNLVRGEKKTTHKLRDWVFSRQRYWGEPIPIIICEKCGFVPVHEEDLPVTLPEVENYRPTDTGESPLANIEKWVNVKCPKCGGVAKRETDVMPNWAGSSWYYIAYCISDNLKSQDTIFKQIQSTEIQNKIKYWLPIDWYNGGMEHTTLHLLYSRFWHKFLYDNGFAPTLEPYAKRTSHGMVLAEGGEKMSKSKGNVVNPNEIVKQFGADTVRLYEMFMGPFDQAIPWNTDNMVGVRRFLEKVWRLRKKVISKQSSVNGHQSAESSQQSTVISQQLESLLHKTIKKVGEDIEALKFNTALSAMMIFTNELDKLDRITYTCYATLVRLLAHFAPHMTEEVWSSLGETHSIHEAPWPAHEEGKLREETSTVVIQVNGKVRDSITVACNETEETIKKLSFEREIIQKWVQGKKIKNIFYIPKKILNIVLE